MEKTARSRFSALGGKGKRRGASDPWHGSEGLGLVIKIVPLRPFLGPFDAARRSRNQRQRGNHRDTKITEKGQDAETRAPAFSPACKSNLVAAPPRVLLQGFRLPIILSSSFCNVLDGLTRLRRVDLERGGIPVAAALPNNTSSYDRPSDSGVISPDGRYVGYAFRPSSEPRRVSHFGCGAAALGLCVSYKAADRLEKVRLHRA